MDITETPYRIELATGPREGLHVSDIIRRILNSLYPGKYGEWDATADNTRLVTGLAWEDYLGKYLESQGRLILHNPHLILEHNIHATPDFIDTTDDGVVIETKATWTSSRHDLLEKHRPWLWQIQSYCRGTGFDHAQLYVLFVNGDYRDSGPQIKRWDFTFTQEDLETNWGFLVGQAREQGLLK